MWTQENERAGKLLNVAEGLGRQALELHELSLHDEAAAVLAYAYDAQGKARELGLKGTRLLALRDRSTEALLDEAHRLIHENTEKGA